MASLFDINGNVHLRSAHGDFRHSEIDIFVIKPNFLFFRYQLPCQLIAVVYIIASYFGPDHVSFMLQLLPREKKRNEYHEAVKNHYKHLPEVKRSLRYKGVATPWL